MKLERVLENLNSFEKNSFLKIINDILSNNPKNEKKIDAIITESSRDLKNADNAVIAKVFNLIEEEFTACVEEEFLKTTSQLDILTDILIRDGNCLMKTDWFSTLYTRELKSIEKKVKSLEKEISANADDEESRSRDYNIYKNCLRVAYTNDDFENADRKVTKDEQSILIELADNLNLSQEEVKLINYTIIPIRQQPIDDVINELKNAGVLFYSKKYSTVYVADEMVRVLRKIRGKVVADKFFRRVLKQLREPLINIVCRKHNIDWKQSYEDKIKEIIKEGISFTGVLKNDIHRKGTTKTEKKKFLNELCDKGLNITPSIKGVTAEEKIDNLIKHFEQVEKDERVLISIEGYEKLLIDLDESLQNFNTRVKNEYELQEEFVLKSAFLLDYNIKPRDILEVLSNDDLKLFCEQKDISMRGDEITNILDNYKDSENLYLENYENIGFRDLNSLKENGLRIRESEIGVKFEDITKGIFEQLGFNVDESLRKELNNKKNQIDILVNLGNGDLIIVECKTVKDKRYDKFSSVSRQLKSYMELAKKNDYRVIKSLLIAPEFSDDFVSDCELEYELNLSLITASALKNILTGFKESKHKQLPYKLLMRDVLIKEDRIIKAISK